TITFWHIYGSGKTALLDELISQFEAMYPNVNIEHTSQSDYNTLREKINLGISVGQVPTMALGYPDHFAGYVVANAAVKLDNYINSNVVYEITNSASSIFGETVSTALDLNDFVPSYLAENNQYVGGYYYSVPYSKSTETMAVNRTVLKAHVAEIRALGIQISDEGFLSHSTPLTWSQLEQLRPILTTGTAETNVAQNKCAYLVNYDSSGNLFINMSREWKAGYTNPSGQILINNNVTRAMLNYLKGLFDNETLVLPIMFDQQYGSNNFKYGDLCMTVGSTAGVAYNIPSAADPAENLKFGIFNVDFLQVPQMVANTNDNFTVGSYTGQGALSAVQQGPNIGIFSSASRVEKLYAWLFIKFLIETDNTARWAMDTGYLPARISAYESEVQIRLTPSFSITYSGFIQIAQDYWAADGNPGWAPTDSRWNYLYSSMVANIAKNQNAYYQYDPAFAAGTNSAGSATVRVEAGYCLEKIVTGEYTPEGALNFFLNQVTW
ncbi:MAG TPA: extracellular solute-binding protein, partial [Candidatus Izemoplasmatales bacterium]|nr:extracellular solute-binding protein [Candidatus Izemoplasmatales bacterium]